MNVTARKAWLTSFSWDHQTTLHGLGVELIGMLDDDRHFLASRISEYLELSVAGLYRCAGRGTGGAASTKYRLRVSRFFSSIN
jgi:hypothetical protein